MTGFRGHEGGLSDLERERQDRGQQVEEAPRGMAELDEPQAMALLRKDAGWLDDRLSSVSMDCCRAVPVI
jgi:hypothetical protein